MPLDPSPRVPLADSGAFAAGIEAEVPASTVKTGAYSVYDRTSDVVSDLVNTNATGTTRKWLARGYATIVERITTAVPVVLDPATTLALVVATAPGVVVTLPSAAAAGDGRPCCVANVTPTGGFAFDVVAPPGETLGDLAPPAAVAVVAQDALSVAADRVGASWARTP